MYNVSIVAAGTQTLALAKYKDCAGLASGFFCAAYYILTSIMLFITGLFHNGGLIVLPTIFVVLSFIALFTYKYARKNIETTVY